MPAEADQFRVALTTVGSLEEGREMAHALVERRLAACVNLIPKLTSVYRWKGAIEEAEEVLLVMKTTKEQLAELDSAVREMHSYNVPEFLVLPVESGSQPYLAWLLDSVSP